MKKRTLKLHYITLIIFCQVFCFFFSSSASAVSNSLSITCPSELTPNSSVTCSISIVSNININEISGTFASDNIKIEEFSPSTSWKVSLSDKNFTAKSSSVKTGETELGTIKITTSASDITDSLAIVNLVFKLDTNYSFSVISSLVEIKILPKPATPTCADDEELVDGQCVKKTIECAEDEDLVDGKCVKKIIECAEDEELINGKCVKKIIECAEDEELVDGICVKKPPECKEGEILVGNVCKEEQRTPTCPEGESYVGNVCVKDTDPKIKILTIIVIVGVIGIIVGIIIVIIKMNKKNSPGKGGSYLGPSGKSLPNSPFVRTGQPQNGSYLGSSRKNTVNQSVQPIKQQTFDNGNYMSRAGEVSEANPPTPPINNDPRLQMNLNNSAEALERKAPTTPVPVDQNGQPILNPNDPRLQIQFNGNQQEMQLRSIQNKPLVSAYDVATQATPEAQPAPKEVIAKNETPVQPSGPLANQYQTQPQTPIVSAPTQSVELTKPTTPDVFES